MVTSQTSMCSSTGSGAGGYVGGGFCGGGGGDECGLNRSKRQRVPKRGPGVAELEKILREQETHFDEDMTSGGFSSSCLIPPHSGGTLIQPLPEPTFMSSASISLPPKDVLLLPDHAHFAQFLPPLNGNRNGHGHGDGTGSVNGNGNGNGGSKGIYIGGSGLVLPEKALMPMLPGIEIEGPKVGAGLPFTAQLRNGSDQAQMFPPIVPEKYSQFKHPQPQMMNYFHQPALSFASVPPISAGPYHHVEPPSTPRPHQNSTSAWPVEDKMASMKRQRTFYEENPPACPLAIPNHLLCPSIQTLDASFSKNHAIFNPRKSLRDTASINHLELTTTRLVSNGRDLSGNNFFFASAAAPLPSSQICQKELSMFKSFPFQEACEVSHRQSEPDAPKYQKPLCSFVFDEQQICASQTSLSSNNEKFEPRDGIDLNLKL